MGGFQSRLGKGRYCISKWTLSVKTRSYPVQQRNLRTLCIACISLNICFSSFPDWSCTRHLPMSVERLWVTNRLLWRDRAPHQTGSLGVSVSSILRFLTAFQRLYEERRKKSSEKLKCTVWEHLVAEANSRKGNHSTQSCAPRAWKSLWRQRAHKFGAQVPHP